MEQGDNFRGVYVVTVGKGDIIMFWEDSWNIDGSTKPFMTRFPRILSFVLNDKLSVLEVSNLRRYWIYFIGLCPYMLFWS
jgi:hypothetical protein